jgi:hypothetical protein
VGTSVIDFYIIILRVAAFIKFFCDICMILEDKLTGLALTLGRFHPIKYMYAVWIWVAFSLEKLCRRKEISKHFTQNTFMGESKVRHSIGIFS